jgi:hypothetical protein|tara:strand:+ start:57 stop:806 length:750 start_codon:yes stop_codon:yes gene_type:complete
MAGFTYTTLKTAIKNYTETDDNVLTTTIIDQFIENAEFRIFYDVPSDNNRFVSEGNLAVDDNTINVPGLGTKGNTGTVFVRGVEVFNSTSASTGPGTWLIKKDQTYLTEYVDRLTGTEGGQPDQDVTGFPKYYAMFGGATGTSSSTSGGLYLAPTPDANYMHRIYYDMVPKSLTTTATTYISQYFPQGLLYATLVEAFGYLKGPMDMLTLYENKYKQEIQKFAGVQIGRRRRDDYTDGTVRIPVKSPSP